MSLHEYMEAPSYKAVSTILPPFSLQRSAISNLACAQHVLLPAQTHLLLTATARPVVAPYFSTVMTEIRK